MFGLFRKKHETSSPEAARPRSVSEVDAGAPAPPASAPDVPIEPSLVEAVLAEFRDVGIEAVWEPDAPQGPGIALSGAFVFLANLQTLVRDAGRRERRETVRAFVASVAAAEAVDDALSPDEMIAAVRVRLLPEDDGWAYARPIAPGLVAALAVDAPASVVTIQQGHPALEGDLASLFAAGLANLRAEEVAEVAEVAAGLWVLEGPSFFVASQILDLERVRSLCAADGAPLVVGVPTRSTLLVVPVRDAGAVVAVTRLVEVLQGIAEDVPGGILSREAYFVDDGVFQVITDGPRVLAQGAFLDRLNAVGAG